MRQTEFVSSQRKVQGRGLGRGQSGVSLLGLLFWGVLLAFTGVVAARVFPTVLEFYTIQTAVNRIAASNPPTVPAVRADFDKTQQIEYSIVSISSKDLVISKDNEKLKIAFAYEKQIELGGPVYLLIKYEGHSR
ncbi:DUF4845 domain-containing protein [Roseateles oligotrophus]|uniref:DUF4845 domain-containing protein n=1 Tax=Roseateles oligotrophus TaxID=1769250 RepID=A0ABT2YIK5_9BURK|nr:DUF4845 domain-containing protein [Roseateles oligotrophus]MCV2369903.1 DUF4845 domain-containing protein [Roseateles oligotrophus]